MKNIVLISAICVAFIACNNNSNNNTATDTTTSSIASAPTPFGFVKKHTWAGFNLQGKVKEIAEYTFLDGQEPTNMPSDTTGSIRVTEFSPEGFVTRITEYEDGLESPFGRYDYQYNTQGQLATIKMTNSGDTDVETESYQYTPEGFLSSYTYTTGDSNEPPLVITYTTTTTPEGTQVVIKEDSYTETRLYNQQNLLQKRTYADNAQNKGEVLYSYDSNNRCLKEAYQGGIGSLFVPTYYEKGTVTFQYDKYGNLTQALLEEAPEANAPAESYKFGNQYTYDAQGNITRASINMGQEPLVKIYKITYY